MSEETTIPNWTIFGAHAAGLTIYEVDIIADDDEDGKTISGYQVAFDLFLDDGVDGVKQDDPEAKHITICTDILTDNLQEAAQLGASLVVEMFQTVADEVIVINKDGEPIDTLSLADLVEEEIMEDMLGNVGNPSGILH